MFLRKNMPDSPPSLPLSTPPSNLFTKVVSSQTYIIFAVSFGLLVDMANYGMMVPVLPFRLHDIGYHNVAAASSYLIAAFALGLIASSIPISILGELIKQRNMSLKTPLLICLIFLCGSLVLFWRSTSLHVLVIARILQGFSATGIWTLGLALLCEVVPEKRIGVVMGYVMIGWSIGTVMGPLAGGLLYDSLGYHSIFIFALILAGIDFALRLMVSDRKAIENRQTDENSDNGYTLTTHADPSSESSFKSSNFPNNVIEKDIRNKTKESDSSLAAQTQHAPFCDTAPGPGAAVWSLLFSARAWTLCLIIFVLGFAFGGLLDTGMTLIVHARYGLNSRGAALVFIGAVVPSFASSPLAGHFTDKYGARWPTLICLILGTPFFGLISMEGSLATFVVWVAMTGLFVMAIAAPIMQDLTEMVKITPGLGYAHVYGIFNMVYSTGALVGPLCVGVTLQRVGVQSGWRLISLISALLCLLCIVPAWLYLPSKQPQHFKAGPENNSTPDFSHQLPPV